MGLELTHITFFFPDLIKYDVRSRVSCQAPKYPAKKITPPAMAVPPRQIRIPLFEPGGNETDGNETTLERNDPQWLAEVLGLNTSIIILTLLPFCGNVHRD